MHVMDSGMRAVTEVHAKPGTQPRDGEVREGFQQTGMPGMSSGWVGLSQAGNGAQTRGKTGKKLHGVIQCGE